MGNSGSVQAPPKSPSSKKVIRVAGVGDPLMDVIVNVDHGLLGFLGARPGSCVLLKKYADVELLLKTCDERSPGGRAPRSNIAGGSAANVMKGLAQLGKGIVSVELVGVLGKDSIAVEYKQQMNLAGVGTAALLESRTESQSGQAICLVSPDGQRTMRTFLGAAAQLDEQRISSTVPAALLSSAQLLHVEGYALRRPGAARTAVLATSAAGGVVSLDLASPELIADCFGALSEILSLNAVDLVFGNEQEVMAVGQQEALSKGMPPPQGPAAREAGIVFLLKFVQVVNVTLGAEGALTVRKDLERFLTPALPVHATDTTGAGDTFVAGYLWALLHGAPLPICAAQGCAMAAEAVRVAGSSMDDATWRKLREGSYGFQPPEQAGGMKRVQSEYGPNRPENQALTGAPSGGALAGGGGMKGAASRGNVWGNGDEAYDAADERRHPNDDPLVPSDYALDSEGHMVKIKRTMSGRIYGAVFDQVEQAGPPAAGGLRRSMSSRVGDDFGMSYREFAADGSLSRSESQAAIARLESAGAAGGCGGVQLPGGYTTYMGYLVAWGLGWLEEDAQLDAESAGSRMRRSMSSRVMSGRSIS